MNAPELQVGDNVLISKVKSIFEKGANHRPIRCVVLEVDHKKKTYILKNMTGLEPAGRMMKHSNGVF
jgi:hypothetical protein